VVKGIRLGLEVGNGAVIGVSISLDIVIDVEGINVMEEDPIF
jgi:hypothetical protein